MKKILCIASVLFALCAQPHAYASEKFEVSITNLTHGISFTPILAVAHHRRNKLFTLGTPASEALTTLAEGGNTQQLTTQYINAPKFQTQGLLAPGQTVTFTLNASKHAVFSMASMLLPTNDTFVALKNKSFPRYTHKKTYLAHAYDAGVETNSESCADIPGPHCNGAAESNNDHGEGFVFPSPSIHGERDLSRALYQWQGAVAKVVIVKK
jgi:hypothetical protein